MVQSSSAVKVSDVYFSRVHGTTSTDKAVELKCSQIVACTNIVLIDINIVSASPEDTTTGAYCFNAYGSAGPTVPLLEAKQLLASRDQRQQGDPEHGYGLHRRRKKKGSEGLASNS